MCMQLGNTCFSDIVFFTACSRCECTYYIERYSYYPHTNNVMHDHLCKILAATCYRSPWLIFLPFSPEGLCRVKDYWLPLHKITWSFKRSLYTDVSCEISVRWNKFQVQGYLFIKFTSKGVEVCRGPHIFIIPLYTLDMQQNILDKFLKSNPSNKIERGDVTAFSSSLYWRCSSLAVAGQFAPWVACHRVLLLSY
jgi:hypothetical protein